MDPLYLENRIQNESAFHKIPDLTRKIKHFVWYNVTNALERNSFNKLVSLLVSSQNFAFAIFRRKF